MLQKIIINENQLPTLSNIFLPSIIKELAKFGFSLKFDRILKYSFNDTYEKVLNLKLLDLFDAAYINLEKKYPNEYIYKNVLANKILLGTHSLNTSYMLTELGVKNSKADCVIVNGTLTVYEIKTKYDNFSRLDKQIEDYKKVFDKIYIITDEKNTKRLQYLKKDGIGLLRLNKRGTISKIFDSISHKDNIELSYLFDILRRDEYLFIINKLTNIKIDVPNSQLYRCAKKIFVTLNKEDIYKEVVEILKKRGESKELKKFILNAPISLKARVIETSFTKKEQNNFSSLLETQLKDIIQRG